MDYKKILLAYMRGIVRNGGTTYVNGVRRSDLTPSEQHALFEIENEVRADPAMKGYWV